MNRTIIATGLFLSIGLPLPAYSQIEFPQQHSAVGQSFPGIIGKHIHDSIPSFKSSRIARADAPNVVIILLDDLGYADLGAYGSEIETPSIDRLAAGGVRYRHFTATALCSPSRAALLTGLNHHSAGLGWLATSDAGYPGYRGELSHDAITLAEILKEEGYATMMVGKWHLAIPGVENAAGPFDNWPTHRGFQRYWGFLAGETSQWYPHQLVDGTTIIDTPTDGRFYFPDALTDRAIEMIREQKIVRPDQPIFLYYATGAPHAPHHTKPEDLARYKGNYDDGWDNIREQRLARQLAMGLVPKKTELTRYGPEVPKTWNELSDNQKKMYARFQENYAAFVDNIDQNIGRLLNYLDEIGELDNTLVILTSDNGASREVSHEGGSNVWGHWYNSTPSTNDENLEDFDEIGSWRTHPHYPRGWMQASNTPFFYGKNTTFGGGVNVPLIISWADGIAARGEIRSQFHHMNDIAPTVLELLNVTQPDEYRGRKVKPMEGVSMVSSLENPSAPDVKTEQYYEMVGHRAYYANGWRIVTWRPAGKKYDEVPWELYDLQADFSEYHNLADQYPDKVKELENRWWDAAEKYNVLPINDLSIPQRIALLPPSELVQRTHFEFYPSDNTIPWSSQPALANRVYQITAQIERQNESESGVLVARGDYYAGWSLYIKNNRLIYENNLPNVGAKIISAVPVPIGAMTVKYAFDPDKNRPGLSGTGKLYIGDKLVGEGKIESQVRSSWEGLDIGRDTLTPVSRSYQAPNTFQGTLTRVVFDLNPL